MDESLANIRHERSKKDFPALKLEDGEYVEFAFSRAKICYLLIWGCVAGGDRSFRGWAWMLGSGGMFALYIWFGIRKLMDRAQ